MAAHESPRTTKLYDRTKERLTQDEVEGIPVLARPGVMSSKADRALRCAILGRLYRDLPADFDHRV